MYIGNLRKHSAVVLALAVVGASFFLGIAVGYINRPAVEKVANVFNQETSKPAEVDFGTFWDVWSRLEKQYVDKSKIDRQKLIDGAIAGMVRALGDPYTVYFPPQEAKEFQAEIKGSFEGIGAEIGLRKGIITIIAPLKNSPAERAGLKAGDKILKIDDTVTSELSVDEAVRLIRGEKGTKVKLTIFRDKDGEPREVAVTRDTIVVPNITTEKRSDGVFVIELAHFSESSPSDFRGAVQEFANSGSTKLVLDLRNNPGGYLETSIDISSNWVSRGDVVVKEVNFKKTAQVKLNTKITDKLKAEGEAREIIRQIQQARKEAGCRLNEKVTVILPGWPKEYRDYIMREAQAETLIRGLKLAIKRK